MQNVKALQAEQGRQTSAARALHRRSRDQEQAPRSYSGVSVRAVRLSPMIHDRQKHEDLTANSGRLIADGLRCEAALLVDRGELPRVDYRIDPDRSSQLSAALTDAFAERLLPLWLQALLATCISAVAMRL